MISGLGESWAASPECLVNWQESMNYKSTTIDTLWPGCTVTSSKDRWIGAYSIVQTILRKLSCQIKKKKWVLFMK